MNPSPPKMVTICSERSAMVTRTSVPGQGGASLASRIVPRPERAERTAFTALWLIASPKGRIRTTKAVGMRRAAPGPHGGSHEDFGNHDPRPRTDRSHCVDPRRRAADEE